MWLFTHEESVLLPGKQNKQGTLRDCNIQTFWCGTEEIHVFINVSINVRN